MKSNRMSRTWACGGTVLGICGALRGGGAKAAALGLHAGAPGAACAAVAYAAVATC